MIDESDKRHDEAPHTAFPSSIVRSSALPSQPPGLRSRWEWAAIALCVNFGLASILNITTAADGTWIEYAQMFNQGIRLYRDLHMVQQPFFVLETAWFLDLFGSSWLATKIPAVFHLSLFVFGIFGVVRRSDLPGTYKALLGAATFFICLNTVAFRFDDYHVVSESAALYTIILLLEFYRTRHARRQLLIALLIGIIAGFAIENRLNDGAALTLAAAISLCVFCEDRRSIVLATFLATTLACARLLIALTGDSFSLYWHNSITAAAGPKGGTGTVLRTVLALPLNSLKELARPQFFSLLCLFVLFCFILARLILPSLTKRRASGLRSAAGGVLLLLIPISAAIKLHNLAFLVTLDSFADLLLYGVGSFCLIGWLLRSTIRQQLAGWNPLQVLLLIPAGHLAASAMSSGGLASEYYAPFGMLFLLVPISFLAWQTSAYREFLLCAATILLVYCMLYRAYLPYRWLTFRSKPMFVERQWYHHPVYGPMYLDTELLQMMKPVCQTVASASAPATLFSTPYSYANYFCAIPPWQNSVQTWFDTASAKTIQSLILALQAEPPGWIFYQNVPEVLQMHEMVFHGGHQISYRDLINLVQTKIADGSWKVVYRNDYGSSGRRWSGPTHQEWLLIRTR